MPQVASESDGLDRVTVRLVAAEAMGRLQHPLPEDHYLESSRLAGQPAAAQAAPPRAQHQMNQPCSSDH